jgi:hypothetical protein
MEGTSDAPAKGRGMWLKCRKTYKRSNIVDFDGAGKLSSSKSLFG